NPKEPTMQVNPYLFYNGNCDEALKFYQRVLGARIEAMHLYETGPADMPIPADYKKKIMHARVTIDGEVLMASDAAPGHFQQPRRQSAAAADPTAHGRRVRLEHHLRGFRFGVHPAAPVDRARGVEAEHRAPRYADAIARHRTQHQRAGRQAGPVDHDAFAGFA